MLWEKPKNTLQKQWSYSQYCLRAFKPLDWYPKVLQDWATTLLIQYWTQSTHRSHFAISNAYKIGTAMYQKNFSFPMPYIFTITWHWSPVNRLSSWYQIYHSCLAGVLKQAKLVGRLQFLNGSLPQTQELFHSLGFLFWLLLTLC